MALFEEFLSAFVLLFAIIDPFASIPVYLGLTKKFSDEEKVKSANTAVLVAGIIAFTFLFVGMSVLDAFHITLNSFKIFGGFILALLALETTLGITFSKSEATGDSLTAASVIIATPMLTGPGVMTSVIVLSTQFGYLVTSLAVIAALGLSWLILRNSIRIQKILGHNTIEVASKVLGLLLGAVGVELMRAGFGA